MPLASLTTAPPPVSVPVPTRASDTEVPATPLPKASATLICTAGAIATPATTLVGWTVNASDAAAAGETVNAVLVTLGSAPLEAVTCLLPARLMLTPAKLALPLASLTAAPPPVSVPAPTSASETELPDTALPNPSTTLTRTAGAIATPATTSVGWAANASDAAAAGDTVNAALVTPGSAPHAAVSCLLPARLMLTPANLAMPLASLTTAPPPLSVPVPTRARDTEAPGTPLPNASATLICAAGAIA